jgi:hypothetical protein
MPKSNQWSDFKNENSFKIAITKSITFVKGESAPDASEAHNRRIKFKFPLLMYFMRLQRASEANGALSPLTKLIGFVMAILKLFSFLKSDHWLLFCIEKLATAWGQKFF